MTTLRAMVTSVLFVLSSQCFAGLIVCNNTAQPSNIALGWKEGTDWVSKGWWEVQPRDCRLLIIGELRNKYYYYYAESKSGDLKWNDSKEAHFCTTDDKFYYNSNSDNCVGENFRRVDVEHIPQYIITLAEKGDPTAAALKCAETKSSGLEAFSKCWMSQMATAKQRHILKCVDGTNSKASLALCAASSSGEINSESLRIATCANSYNESRNGGNFLECLAQGSLNQDQAKLFQCAVSNSDITGVTACAALGSLTPEQRRIVSCVANNKSNYVTAGLCAAQGQLSPEQSRITGCVLNNRGSYMQMGVCAVGPKLTPEQQVFASCAISTGGQPYAFAGCVGTQLTANELQKCFTDGIGGDGCFGNNNTAVKFATNAWSDITKGPGPSNDLLGRDGFVGRSLRNAENDLRNGPGPNNDIVGRDGFVGRTLRNADSDIRNGPGNTNDIVGKDGWVCQNLFGGC